jgi:Chromosome segregation ATPases
MLYFVHILYLCFFLQNVLKKMRSIITIFFIFVSVVISASQSLPIAIYNESKVDSLCRIVQSNDFSYSKKLSIISDFTAVSLYSEYFNKLFPMFTALLEGAQQNSDENGKLFCYNCMANLYFGLWDKENTKKYLDSAEVYTDKSNNSHFLASYYGNRGRYIQRYFPDRMPDAISNYQNSLNFYDKSGEKGKEDELVLIVRNLALDGFQRNDSAYICKNIHKIVELKKSISSPIVEFFYLDVNAALNELYFLRTSNEKFLDSMINCAGKCLKLYENGLLPISFKYIAIDFYAMIADATSQKKGVDIALIDSLLIVAENKYDPNDSIGLARIYQTKSLFFFYSDMIDSSEVWALKSQKYLESGYKSNNYSRVKTNIDILRNIYFLKGDYKKAIEYDDLWTKKDEEIKANEIKELELQFEVEMKDSELKRLNSDIMYYNNLHKLYIIICILLCLATLFLVLLIRSKRKGLNSRLALIDAEREETKLKLKLKEEQAVKAQLEKYEVLSDFHLKEMELIGKTKDLEQLYVDKENLDKQVDLFRQKIEEYDMFEEKGEQTNYDVQKVISEDLKRLISRQISNGDFLINNINSLSKAYIASLCERCQGKLSVSYLKYCICFAIGMGISDVAECFNIEQSSVHMIRYRLKKKFGLGNDDDLSLFLQEFI